MLSRVVRARKIDLGRLWLELRRRHVVRVALFYVAGAWLVTQVADVMLEAFELEHLLRFVIAGLGVGLPVVLVLSWFFDITAQGIERTAPLAATRPAPDGSIAVLPLANLSSTDAEYFSDGLSEEIRNQLAKTKGLRVAARTSSFAFKGQHQDVREIGRRLGVAYVLEGGVRKQADTVRISLHLVDVADGYQVWSETFERRVDDIFALQSEIALAVIAAVRPQVAAQAQGAPATSSFDAYNMYLLGRHHFHKRTEAALQRAVECFRAAIAKDADYALAYTGLADAYSLLSAGYYGNLPAADAIALAAPAAERGLALAPELAEAHASRGLIRYNRGDLGAAEQALHEALRRNPSYTLAHVWLSNVLLEQGRYRDSAARTREALRLDPLSPIVNSNAGFDALRFGDEREAEARFAASVEIDREFPVAYSGMARLCARRGELVQALAWITRAVELAPTRAYYLARKCVALLRLGKLDEAGAVLSAADRLAPGNPELATAALALAIARDDRPRLESIARGTAAGFSSELRAQAALTCGDAATATSLYAGNPPDPARVLRALIDDESGWRPPHAVNYGHLALLAAPQGRAPLQSLLAQIDAVAAQGIVSAECAYWAASAHAVLGATEKALAKLDEAVELGWRDLWWAQRDFNLEPLAAEARYRDRLGRVGAAIERARAAAAAVA